MPTVLTAGKRKHLRALANSAGVIAAVAMDQRGSLVKAIAESRGIAREEIPAETMSEFKASVCKILSPHASAILLDPEYGLAATGVRNANCGLLLAYEFSGYDNSRPGRLPDLLENVSARRIREWGANACKVLIYYSPFDSPRVNDIKHALIERVGSECVAEDIPFFLELLSYDPEGGDEKGFDYARLKPRIAVGTIVEFCKARYSVDVLKVEVPIVSRYTEGSRAFCDLYYLPLAHPIDEHISLRIEEYRSAHRIRPVVVMRQSSHACFYAAKHYRDFAKCLSDPISVYERGTIGT